MNETKLPSSISIILIIVSLFTLSFATIFLIITWPSPNFWTFRSIILILLMPPYPYVLPSFTIAGTVIFGTDIINLITYIIAILCMIAGIKGLIYRKKPERLKSCIKLGFAIMILELIVYVVTLVLFAMDATRVIGWSIVMLLGVFVPAVYTYAAYQADKFYKLQNRS